MVFTHKSLLNRNERILLYLFENPHQSELPDASENLTASGIADAIVSNRSNIFYNLKELRNKKYINEFVKYIKGKKKKQKVYSLSITGKTRARQIKNELLSKEITFLTADNELSKIMFPEVLKHLEALNICTELSDLKVCKYINFNGILDVNLLTELNTDSFEFPSFIIKPEIFYGREKELGKLKIWIDKKRKYNYIIIYGMAGIGKTTLISRLVLSYKGKMNIFWHSLNEWDTKWSVVTKVLNFFSKINENDLSLSITQDNLKNSEKTLELLKQNLKEINALIIFDDLHKIKQELRDFFTILIRTFGRKITSKFIFLSRYNIPFYDQYEVLSKKSVVEFELKGLDFKNSIELLGKKGIPQKDFKEIYKITAGNPLLLEIIDSDYKTKRYIYEETFSKLSKKEQIVMEVISTFRESAPYDALFINNSIPPNIIENLTQKSIIKLDPDGLYLSHDYIKDYFYKRLNPHIRSEYHKHCAEFLINDNNQDLVEIFYHLLKAKEYREAIDIAFSKAQDIIHQGCSEKFLVILEEFPEIEIPIDNFAEILLLKAKLNFIIGNWEKSLEFYNRAIEISIQSGNENTKAKAYCKIGHILEEKNVFDEALKNFRKSLEISKAINDPELIAESNRGIGRYYWRKGNYTDAELYYTQSLNVLKYTNNSKLIGIVKIDIGNVYFENGNYDQAVDSFQNALKYLEKVEDKLEIARAYNSLGTAFLYRDEFNNALEYFKKQIDMAKIIGDIRLIGYGLSNIGYCYARQYKNDDALIYIKEAMKINEKIENDNILFTINFTYGLMYKNQKNWNKAIEYFKDSVKIIKKINAPFYLSKVLIDLGLSYKENSDYSNAKKCIIEALNVYKKNEQIIPDRIKKIFRDFNILK